MIPESMKAMGKLQEDLAKVDPRPRITGIQDPTKRKPRPPFRGRVMAHILENIRSEAVHLSYCLIDRPDHSHNQKIDRIDHFIQGTRERCHVLQAEVDEWKGKMAVWEKESKES